MTDHDDCDVAARTRASIGTDDHGCTWCGYTAPKNEFDTETLGPGPSGQRPTVLQCPDCGHRC